MKDKFWYLLGGLVIVALVLGIAAVTPLILMVAWNYVAAGLFNLPLITFWQSFAVVVILGVVRMALTPSRA